tara:strand:- start:992 stop:1750 length:759 start_codon:yes stop_codon:yes gene_type:complete
MNREDKNINNAVRVSQVQNINEEKLKFKVIVGVQENPGQHGAYRFNLPPLTDLCNSNEYNQAVIKVDQVIIDPASEIIGGVAYNNARPLWTDRNTGPGAGAAPFNNSESVVGGVMLTMRLPSRQTGSCATNISNDDRHSNLYYRFQELIPTFWTWRGNYQGVQTTNNNLGGAGAVDADGNSYAITHKPNNDGVLCANPFGSEIEFNFKNPCDVDQDQVNLYLADALDMTIPRIDITRTMLQLSITLIPNRTN